VTAADDLDREHLTAVQRDPVTGWWSFSCLCGFGSCGLPEGQARQFAWWHETADERHRR